MTRTFSSWRTGLAGLALCLALGGGCTQASKVRRLLAAADRDYAAKKYDAAALEYQTALRLSPGNAEAVRQLAFIYNEDGAAQYFVYLKAAYELQPANTQIQLKLAQSYAENRQLKDAAEMLAKVRHAEPANEQAIMLLAQISTSNELAGVRQELETQLREGGGGGGEAACRSALAFIDIKEQKTNEAASEVKQALALDPKMISAYLGQAAVSSMQRDTNGVERALKTAFDLSPARSPVRLKYVDFKLASGKTEEAKAILEQTTKDAPDYIPAWLYLMKMSFAERKYDDCNAIITRVLARDEANFDANLELGALYLTKREPAKAVSTFEHMQSLYKSMPLIKYNLGLSHLMNGEKQKALADLNEALAMHRDYPQAMLVLAELDYRSGNLSEAINLLLDLNQKHPENAEAQLQLAEAYSAEDQLGLALQVYEHMAQIFPKNPEIPRRTGVVYERQGDLAQARAAFEKSLELTPDYMPSLREITRLDIYQKNYEQAHHRLDGAMDRNPKAAEPYLLQGDVFREQMQTNQAEASYTKAIELNPEMPTAYLSLAQLYRVSHQEEKALARLKALVDKTKDVSAMMLIGVIHQTEGQYDQAREDYEKLLAVDPKNVSAMNNLAYVFSEYLNQTDAALKLAENARRLKPYDPYTADTLGWILYKKHDYSRALSLVQESAERQPDDPEVLVHLGLSYYMMEEEKPARLCLERALGSHANLVNKDLVLRRMEILEISPTNTSPENIEKLKKAIHDDPKDPVPVSRLAAIQEEMGQTQAATASLQNLLTINPQNYEAMIRLAWLEYKQGETNKAMKLANEAHTLAPDDGHASALLGELAFELPDYGWSLSLLQEAASRVPDEPSLAYHLGLAYYAMGRTSEADEAMQVAAGKNSDQAEVGLAKEFLALRAAEKDPDKLETSTDLVKNALAKDPRCVPALMVSELQAQRRGAVDEAEQTCRQVLGIYPDFAPAMYHLAVLYSHSKQSDDLKKAYSLAERAKKTMSDEPELDKVLGLLDYGRADYNSSALLLQAYVNKSLEDNEVYFYLGMDYDKLNRKNDAKESLQHALDLHLPSPQADEAKMILAGLTK